MSAPTRDRLFDCSGLITVVTGGGTGIGLEMARALERNGATVYILGRRKDVLDAAAATAEYGKILPIQADVTSRSDLERAVQQIEKEVGYVNLVIANAGLVGKDNSTELDMGPDHHHGPSIQKLQEILWGSPTQELTEIYDVNVNSVLYTAVAFLDLLDKGNKKGNVRQTSQILMTSSLVAFDRGPTYWPVTGFGYTTSKVVVNHLAKTLANYLIHYRIRVNAIAPGIFESQMTQPLFGHFEFRAEGAVPKSVMPLERTGKDEEMAGTVLYFASEAGGYCSGTVHLFDGGVIGALPGGAY